MAGGSHSARMDSVAGIGVIVNPHARRNRGCAEAVIERLAGIVGDAGEVRACGDPESLSEAADAFRRAGVEVVALCGGDGTNGRVIGALEACYSAAPLPKVALLRGGTMNTTARGLGVPKGRPEDLLRTLVADVVAGRELCVNPRPLIRAGERLGHIFGMGILVTYLDAYYARGKGNPTPWTAFRTLAAAAGSALVRGPLIRRIGARVELELTLDGEVLEPARYFAVAAGTTPQIGLGFTPFPRAQSDPTRFQLLGIACGPVAFLRDLFRFQTGRGLCDHHGVDRMVGTLTVRPVDGSDTVGMMFDGDVAVVPAPLEVSVGPVVEIVVGASE